MAGELILRVKWAQMSVCCSSLFERATMSTFNIACLISWANIFSDMHLCEDSKSLGSSCSSQDILSLQCKVNIASLTLGRKNLRLISLNVSNSHCHTFFISDSVLRAQWVDMSFSHEISLCDIAIIISSEASRVFAFLVSRYSFGPWNIINFISFLGLCFCVPVLLGLGALDVRDVHLVANKLGRSNGTCFDLRKVIDWR